MPYLEVPEAQLYYETVGDGPLFLCISGADGSCEIWRRFAEFLKPHFKVVMWDRRGFSRSYLTGPQDYQHRLEGDADDAARLIKHLSPNEPATVIGNSSGAIVALTLLTRHPDILRSLISYEPPAAKVLPEFDDIWAFHKNTYKMYRDEGPHAALNLFAELIQTNSVMAGFNLNPLERQYFWSNLQYWFEREFMYYPKADFKVDKEMRPLKHKLVFVNGEESPKTAYQFRGNESMAGQLGLPLNILPGGHVSHATCPEDFSKKLMEVLRKKDDFYTSL